jgi:hypothetical protein
MEQVILEKLSSASQEIFRLLWNPNICLRIRDIPEPCESNTHSPIIFPLDQFYYSSPIYA